MDVLASTTLSRQVDAAMQRLGVAQYASQTFDPAKHPRGGYEANVGEFSTGSGPGVGPGAAVAESSGEQTANRTPSSGDEEGLGFVSPNQGPPGSFDSASSATRTPEQHQWMATLSDIARQCGMASKIHAAVGDWHEPGQDPGAEQSAEVELTGAQDYDQVKYAMSIMGRQSHQFAVLPFVEDHSGPDTIWEVDVNDSGKGVRSVLDKYDLPFRTLVDEGQGHTKIIIYDQGTQHELQAEAVAHEYATHLTQRTGWGEFFPQGAADRNAADAAYDQYIAQYEQQHPERPHYHQEPQAAGRDSAGSSNGLPGHGTASPAPGPAAAAPPTDLKARFAAGLQRQYAAWQESQHPRGQPTNAGEFAQTPQKQVAPSPGAMQPQSATGGGHGSPPSSPPAAPPVPQQQLWQEPPAGEHPDMLITRLKAIPEVKEAERRLAEYNQRSLGDVLKHTSNINTDREGYYDAARSQLHARIVDSMLPLDTVAKPNERPQAILMIGNPGSGKTSTRNVIERRVGVKFAHLDTDAIKERMPEYAGWNAPALHQESHDILAEDLLPRAINSRHNIVLDGTGRNMPRMWNLVTSLAKRGYDVHVGYVACPPEKCAVRAIDRFLMNPFNIKDPFGTPGRYVPPEFVIREADHHPERTYQAIKQHPLLKSWMQVNTDVPAGQQPQVVEEGNR